MRVELEELKHEKERASLSVADSQKIEAEYSRIKLKLDSIYPLSLTLFSLAQFRIEFALSKEME